MTSLPAPPTSVDRSIKTSLVDAGRYDRLRSASDDHHV
jgi:hypothetical protein